MIHIDFETRSRTSIKAGASRYSLDAEVMCLSYKIDDGEVHSWRPGEPTPNDLLLAIELGDEVWAHNATFEMAIWRNVMVAEFDWPEIQPKQWRCTMATGMALALPSSLENMAEALKLPVQKDMAGRRLMLKMSKPRKPTKKDNSEWHEKPEDIQRLREYCNQDVVTEAAIHAVLPPLIKRELSVYHFDAKVNLRGVKIDRELAKAVVHVWDQYTARLNAELDELTSGRVTSSDQVKEIASLIRELGVEIDSLNKESVAALLKTDLPPTVRRVLEIRAELAMSSVAKYKAMLLCAEPDDRIRGCFQYHGAQQTGRWAGRLVQLQNLPRGELKAGDIDSCTELVKTRDLDTIELLSPLPLGKLFSSLLRSAIIPESGKRLLVCDFASIEARALAWAAGEEWLLDAFRHGKDAYKEMASTIYGVPYDAVTKEQRFYGKQTILGCFAADTKVLTDRGWKQIISVTTNDKLWDGEEWQQHSGIVYQGVKEVKTAHGIKATPDHLFLTRNGWIKWGELIASPQGIKKATEFANSLSLDSQESQGAGHGYTLLNALAGLSHWLKKSTLKQVAPHDAAIVETRKAKSRNQCGMLLTTMLQGYDFATDCLRWSVGATTPITGNMPVMVGAEYRSANFGEMTPGSFYDTLKHYRVGKTPSWKSTESTTIKVTSPATYILSLVGKTCKTLVNTILDQMSSVQYAKSSSTLTLADQENSAQTPVSSSVPVWDIANVGPRNRFTVMTSDGPCIVHNCGYGMGGSKFRMMLANYGVDASEEFCNTVIEAYRAKNKKIKSLWYATEKAAVNAVRTGQPHRTGPYVFHRKGDWLHARMPCGRDISYYKPELAPGKYGDQVRFLGVGTNGKVQRTSTYGGSLVENLTQAVCRDMLVEAMSRLEKAGYEVVMHVHDEIVCEVPDGFGSIEEMEAIMREVPAWAEGFPVDVEGFECRRYRK